MSKSNNNNRNNNTPMFPAHIERSEALAGVDQGTMIMGKLIVNPNNHQQAYVKAKGLEPDMFVEGYASRNRAIHNDDVVARIVSKAPMKPNSPIIQLHGEVVCILSRPKDEFVGRIVGNREDQSIRKNDLNVLFIPDDGRYQRMLVPLSDFSPENYSDVDEALRGMVVVAKMTKWAPTFPNPAGSLVRPIGQTGAIEAETTALLVKHSIYSDDFSDEVYAMLPKQPWSIEESEVKTRCDLRKLRIFSIDPASCRDMDDAVSVTKYTYNGKPMYEVGIHIADVAHFIPEGSALDKEAFKRGTSVYLVQRVLPMLPRVLCDDVCSLCPNVDRYSFSVTACMDENGNIISHDVLQSPICKSGIIKPGLWFGKTIMKSCAKLAYEHAQRVIQGEDEHVFDNVLSDITSAGFTAAQVSDDILMLHNLAQKMRKKRQDAGCISITRTKLAFKLNKSLDPVDTWSYITKEANFLIEEFMILANVLVAERVYQYFPKGAVERRHGAPKEDYSKVFVARMFDVTAMKPYSVDIKSSLAFREFLVDCYGKLSKVQAMTLSQTASETMVPAQYVCAGDVSMAELHHYGLAIDLYTHFTSPIRRYPDLLVHRQLSRTLIDPSTPMTAPKDDTEIGLYQLPVSVTDACAHCNTCKDNAREAGFSSCAVYMNVFLKGRCALQPAVISGMGEQAFDVFVPALGVKKRVTTSSIPVTDVAFNNGIISFKWDTAQLNEEVTNMLTGRCPNKPKPVGNVGTYSSTIKMFDTKWVLVASQMNRVPITTYVYLLPDEYDVRTFFNRTLAGSASKATDREAMMEVLAKTTLGNALITPVNLDEPNTTIVEEIALLDIAS